MEALFNDELFAPPIMIPNAQQLKNYDLENGTKVMVSRNKNYDLPLGKRVATKILGERTSTMVSDITRNHLSKIVLQGRKTQDPCDIISLAILYGLWNTVDLIFGYLDAVSLVNCECVCHLWNEYIHSEDVWSKNVRKTLKSSPNLVAENGWSKYQLKGDVENRVTLKEYKHLFWKMTNASQVWSSSYRGFREHKNLFNRSGPIVWKFLPENRAITVWTTGEGFKVKIFDDKTKRYRGCHFEHTGAVKKDTLCIDACNNRIVIGGLLSQKVWVYKILEVPVEPQGSIVSLLSTLAALSPKTRLILKIDKYINAGNGVTKIQICPTDQNRMAVLMPINQTVEIWDISRRARLYTFVVTADSAFLFWRPDNVVIAAPIYSGIIMPFDTSNGKVLTPVVGQIRRIDAMAVYKNLCATGEAQVLRLWSMTQSKCLVSWTATKTFLTSLVMNDILVISGSNAGIVKLWDLNVLLKTESSTIAPLRKISMKGWLYYPVKEIAFFSYKELIIVSKYETNKKKDKVKIVEYYKPTL